MAKHVDVALVPGHDLKSTGGWGAVAGRGKGWDSGVGIPAALVAHLVVSAALAGALAWLWRPKAAGVLLGILILTKEAIDLMIVALYQPVTWANASGSIVDVLVSVAGASLGLWINTRVRPGVVEDG